MMGSSSDLVRLAKLLFVVVVSLFALTLFFFWFVSLGPGAVVPSAAGFDVSSFTGSWYATHSFSERFTDDCVCQKARYDLTSQDSLIVANSCLTESGDERVVLGEASPIVDGDFSRLAVVFEGFFRSGELVVVGFEPSYRWVVVGSSDAGSLWFLSREPSLSGSDYSSALQVASRAGFSVGDLVPVSSVSSCAGF